MNWRERQIFYLEAVPERWQHTLLCIHGAGGNARHWSQQLVMAKNWGYRILAVDLPGHGRSKGNPLSSIDSYTLFLEEFLEQLGIRHFSLAGHSMGSAIGIELCLRESIIPKNIILIGTGTKFHVAPWLFKNLEKGHMPLRFIKMAYHQNANPLLIRSALKEGQDIPVSVFLNDFMACQSFDLSHRIAKLTKLDIPFLLIFGAGDLLTPVGGAENLIDLLPHGHLEIVSEAGHMVMIEKPETVNDMIKNFLQAQMIRIGV